MSVVKINVTANTKSDQMKKIKKFGKKIKGKILSSANKKLVDLKELIDV